MGIYPVDRVVINERKTTRLEIPLGLVMFGNTYPHISWSLGDGTYYYFFGDGSLTLFDLPIGTYRVVWGPQAVHLIYVNIIAGLNHLVLPNY